MSKSKTVSSTLVSHLKGLEKAQPDYWTFDGNDHRQGAHALFQYPAMMVPAMQGALLDLALQSKADVRSVFDPFVGSGTILVESMLRGLNFVGIDVNPLAVLVSRVKSTPIPPQDLIDARLRILARIQADKSKSYSRRFSGQSKWFSRGVSIWLSRCTRAIDAEPDLFVRRVFWVALARVVRRVCNSRASTYKLHIKSAEDLIDLRDSVFPVFSQQSDFVIKHLKEHFALLSEGGHIRNNYYTGEIDIILGDSRAEQNAEMAKKADILVTSPPYGDNRTTVPYGQYSYLPLQWISCCDIDENFDESLLSSSHATDTASLGGSVSAALERGKLACGGYNSYKVTMNTLSDNLDGRKRFSAFAADLHDSVSQLAENTKDGAFHIWTVGERRVGGVKMPLTDLLVEMLEAHSVRWLHTAQRRIISKKMPTRNKQSDTMASEQLIIAYKH